MSKLLPLALILIVLVSGCVNFAGGKSMFGIFEIKDNPNLYMNVEVSTDDIKSGRDVKLQFTVNNPGEEPLENFIFTAYDTCLFITEEGENKKEFPELKPNASKIWTWTWTARDTNFPVDCKVKFRASYDTSATFSKTINVLQESEFYSREADGTLGEIRSSSFSTVGNLNSDISFSESQPFLEGEDVYTYIDYSYSGDGQIIKINKDDITIDFPANVDPECSNYDVSDVSDREFVKCGGTTYDCNDIILDDCKSFGCTVGGMCKADPDSGVSDMSCVYVDRGSCDGDGSCDWVDGVCIGGNALPCSNLNEAKCEITETPNCKKEYKTSSKTSYALNKDLIFTNKKAPQTTCKLTTKAEQPIQSGDMRLTVKYKYQFDDSLLLKVNPK
ncbi:MAG: hypothetical protein KJ697_02540 [Nanoarchaeota archaeon]|nr:hypothetical protein [Nanoarchaeota archaeon]MBU4124478.1 hypothetical protein [Nanoarchaeota archaeon]